MPENLLAYKGVFSWVSPYSPGDVVSVDSSDWIVLGNERAWSAGGLYVCTESTDAKLFLSQTIAIPGEALRQSTINAGVGKFDPLPTPTKSAFMSVLPSDVRGPQGPAGPVGPAGVSGNLVYKGVFNWQTQYSPGDVVSLTSEWISFPNKVRARSAGGLHVCTVSLLPAHFYEGKRYAIPGEVSREKNIDWAGDRWQPEPAPTASAFASVLPTDVRGPQGPPGPAGQAGTPGMTWKGVWSKAAYNTNDVVFLNFTVWIANQPVSTSDPAPGAITGSPKWSVVIPKVIPNYRGNWAANTPYNTGDLVMSKGGQQVFALTTNTSLGAYQSTTPPENDTSNWMVVLDFPDSSTAALAMGITSGVLSVVAVATTAGLAIKDAVKTPVDVAGQVATAVNTALQSSQVITELTSRVGDLEEGVNDVAKAILNIVPRLRNKGI